MPCVDDQVNSVKRALSLLDAFSINDAYLTIAELARRTSLPKTSAFRLAKTLEGCGFLVQTDSGAWRLGPSIARLATRYLVAFDLKGVVHPALRDLAKTTGRSATFFVNEGNTRVRLARVEIDGAVSPQLIGEHLPLDRGSPGKVILAFKGKTGKIFDAIRKQGFHVTIGEARSRAASLSAPVFGPGWSVVGAINISCSSEGITPDVLAKYAPDVMAAGRSLSSALMNSHTENVRASPPLSYWHP